MGEAERVVIFNSEYKFFVDFFHDDYEVIYEDENKTTITPFLGSDLCERVLKAVNAWWLDRVVCPTIFISFYLKNKVKIEIEGEDYVETRVAEYKYC